MSADQRGRRNARICENNHLESADIDTDAPGTPGFPLSNALNARARGKVWKPGSNSFTLEIDLHGMKAFTFFAIFGTSNSVFGLSNAAVVTLKANMINLFTGGEPYSKVIPVTDSGAFADLTDATNKTGQQYRFIQIEIDDSLNPNDLEIAYLYLGDHVELPFNVQRGFSFRRIDLSRVSVSDAGNLYGVRKNNYATYGGIGFVFLEPTNRREIDRASIKLGRTNPFIFVLDPLEIQFDFQDENVVLCYYNEMPAFTHAYSNKFNLAFEIREVV